MHKLLISYTDGYLKWLLGSGDGSHPTNPERARIAVELITQELPAGGFEVIEPTVQDGDREKLECIHSREYVAQVLDQGISSEWTGAKPELGQIALQMFAGTVRLVDKIVVASGDGGLAPFVQKMTKILKNVLVVAQPTAIAFAMRMTGANVQYLKPELVLAA